MQSDHGHDSPNTGGQNSEEALWLDLVARLQEPDDGFLAEPEGNGISGGAGNGGAPSVAGSAGSAGGSVPADGAPAKGVDDFDPLGVWRRQGVPAPKEPEPPVRPATHGAVTSGPRDYAAEDADEDFVPPELPSLAGSDPAIMLSWIGAAGGPIFLVLAAIFWRGIPLLGVIAVILAFLVGTGYLIYRLPKNRDHDDGDGAVV